MNRGELHARMLHSLLAPIGPLLADTEVSEIMINGPAEIRCERRGRIEKTSLAFDGHEALLCALRSVAQLLGRPLAPEHPVLEGRLPDGSRLCAVIAPAAPDGPLVSIRRFSRTRLSLTELVRRGTLRAPEHAWLAAAVAAKKNLLVAGGTGSGKTSLLNALSGAVPDGERIVVIEDARELSLQGDHVVQLEAQPGDAQGRGRIGVRELFVATLRMRPDRIVVGEIRGGEALELIQAMTSGHGGCLSTIHASHPRDALARLETLALQAGIRMPLAALRGQIASGVDVIVQIERQRDGARRVVALAEVSGLTERGDYRLRDVFATTPMPQEAPCATPNAP